MSDKRTSLEKFLDSAIGPPLYYCADCLRSVKVTPLEGKEPEVVRPCDSSCSGMIIAPRKALTHGQGGLNFIKKIGVAYSQTAATLTGRCV